MLKSKLFFQVIIASLIATLATVGIVAATSTIGGTNITTSGILTVTGTATSTISGSLSVTGSGINIGANTIIYQNDQPFLISSSTSAGALASVIDANGKWGIGTSSPAATLDVNGYVKALLSATSTACSSANMGSIFFNQANDSFWGCKSSGWVKLDD